MYLSTLTGGYWQSQTINRDQQLAKVQREKRLQNVQPEIEHLHRTPSSKGSGVIAEEGMEGV